MSKRSIGELNVRVSANAAQLLQEMKRADEATRASVTRMDKELGRLQRSMGRKFSIGGMGKDILSGLGFGSGFAVAQQAADAIAKHWEQAAKHAQEIEAISQRIADSVEERMDARKTDEQRLAAFTERQLALAKEIKALNETKTVVVGTRRDREGNVWDITQTRTPSGEDLVRAAQLSEELEKLEVKIAATRKKLGEDRVKQAADGYAIVEQLDAANASALMKTAQGLHEDKKRMAEEEILYQQELYRAELQANEARDKRLAEFTKTRMGRLNAEIFDQAEAALENFKPAAEQFRDEMNTLWNSVSDRAGQAFADMVLTGEASLGSLVEMVTRAVLEITARMAIINPLLNSIFGGMSGWQALPAFGGFFAEGGRPPVGRASVVGERGPELFVPDRPGTIIPNGAAVAGGGSTIYAPTYNIAAGVTRQELLPILKQRDRALVGAMADAQRRGAPISAAFA